MSISSSLSGLSSDESRLIAGPSSRPTPKSKQPDKLDRKTAILIRQLQTQAIDLAFHRTRDLDHATAVVIRNTQLADLDRILQLDATGNDSSGDENGGTEGPQEAAQLGAENDQINRRECMSCRDVQLSFDMTTLPCECRFCHECARVMVQTAVRENQTANCLHGPINIASFKDILRNDWAQQYRQGEIQRSTLNPVYCANQDCAMFLGSGEGLRGIHCQRCRTNTCTGCKTEAHVGDCNDDAGVREVLMLADENEWQRCPGCRTMTERTGGCDRVRCKCGQYFCYRCGGKWSNYLGEHTNCSWPNRLEDLRGRQASHYRRNDVPDFVEWEMIGSQLRRRQTQATPTLEPRPRAAPPRLEPQVFTSRMADPPTTTNLRMPRPRAAYLWLVAVQAEAIREAEIRQARIDQAETRAAAIREAEIRQARIDPAETRAAAIHQAETRAAAIHQAETRTEAVRPTVTLSTATLPMVTPPTAVHSATTLPTQRPLTAPHSAESPTGLTALLPRMAPPANGLPAATPDANENESYKVPWLDWTKLRGWIG